MTSKLFGFSIFFSLIAMTSANNPGDVLQHFGQSTSETLRHMGRPPSPQERAQLHSEAFQQDLQILEERHMTLNQETFENLLGNLRNNVKVVDDSTRNSSKPVVDELIAYYQGILNSGKQGLKPLSKEQSSSASNRLKQLQDLHSRL